ncbi:hypothetical protein [Nocardioides daphniae]|uniref:YCII-related domain-containing protein n=1 Tax=Nocardioides daphniae TaxID=402297 RepID=A0A4P7UA06_9ACTN|nr:hypothetical protein [Nocardioides daphniae]QCC76464.1 hypothetical protein E2C04_03155 [Nocardioides daphniae]GGD06534.1 hypothetical protein GCM10007231_01540 [Nocardioides daphniae]
MGTYLAIYLGAAETGSGDEISAERQSEFMAAWAAWAQAHVDALIDPGAPLFRKKVVTSTGAREFTDAKVGYALVEAPSHDEAVRIFSEHPHLTLHDGNSIEVLECPAIEPG